MVLTDKDLYWINVSDDLTFLNDGKRFLWSSERSGYRHIYLYDLEGKQLAQVTKGNWEVFAVHGVDEAKGLVYFTAAEKSPLERHLYRVGARWFGIYAHHEGRWHARHQFRARRVGVMSIRIPTA